MSNIPEPQDLDAAWFTARLREAGHADAEVASVSVGQYESAVDDVFADYTV